MSEEGEFKRRIEYCKGDMLLVKTQQEAFKIMEMWLNEAAKEFPGCCEPNHYIPISEEMKKWAKENRPDYCPCHEWFHKYFGEPKK